MHFDDVLIRQSSINNEVINRLPQVECNPLLDGFPTVSETVKAIKLLSSGKAPGSVAIPAEILQLQKHWQSYFTLCGEKKPSLKTSRMQQLFTYSKGKGIIKSVTIIEAFLYCQLLGRSLLVLLNRLNEHLEQWGLVTEKGVRKKFRKCHNHEPQPFSDSKRKRKQTKTNMRKSNKGTKSIKTSSLFPKRGNAKRTEKHKNKITKDKT